jgi:hypothetical protein
MTCEQKTMTASVNASERCWIAQNHVGRFTNRKGIRPWVKHGTGHGDWLMVPAVWPFRALTCQSAAVVAAPRKCPPSYKGREKKNFLGWVNERKMLPCEWSGYFGPLER